DPTLAQQLVDPEAGQNGVYGNAGQSGGPRHARRRFGMKSYTVDRTTYDPVDRRLVALGAFGVIAGSAAGAALYTIEPRALLLVAALIAGASALWAVVYMPGVLFALFVCTPF